MFLEFQMTHLPLNAFMIDFSCQCRYLKCVLKEGQLIRLDVKKTG